MDEDELTGAAATAGDDDAPWDADDYGADGQDAARRDAFTGARKRKFLAAFVKTGCLRDACRVTGTAPRTVYNHQEKDPEFLRHCELAKEMGSVPPEITAWERGVRGVEVPRYYKGEVVGTRIRYSDGILRLLLQGANPKKYGARPGFTRKRLMKWEKERMEREIRARIAAERPSFDDAIRMLDNDLQKLGARLKPQRLAEGWTEADDGTMIPPGWVRAPAADPAPETPAPEAASEPAPEPEAAPAPEAVYPPEAASAPAPEPDPARDAAPDPAPRFRLPAADDGASGEGGD